MNNDHDEDDDDAFSCDVATPPTRARALAPCYRCGRASELWSVGVRICAACYVVERSVRPSKAEVQALAAAGVDLAEAFLRRASNVRLATKADVAIACLQLAVDYARFAEGLFRAERELLERELRRLRKGRA